MPAIMPGSRLGPYPGFLTNLLSVWPNTGWAIFSGFSPRSGIAPCRRCGTSERGLKPATTLALFTAALAPGAGMNKQQYMVSPNGRFLINRPAETSTAPPITLILNWKPKF